MRKRLINSSPRPAPLPEAAWLQPEEIAEVELTSEDAAFPVEGALSPGGPGWRAGGPGLQVLRLIFDRPRRLRRVFLRFEEREAARTQEFVLRWSPDGGRSFQEIVRQQWNFSPPGTSEEVEDYRVELAGVTLLELRLTPDTSGGAARASLSQLRLA